MRSCERKRRGTRESSCEVEDSVLGYEHRCHGCLLYVDFLSSLIDRMPTHPPSPTISPVPILKINITTKEINNILLMADNRLRKESI